MMSYETRRKTRPITETGQKSLAKKIEMLQVKKEKAYGYNDIISAKKLEEDIDKLKKRLKTRKLKQDA